MRFLYVLVFGFFLLKFLGRVESKENSFYEVVDKTIEINRIQRLHRILTELGMKFPDVVIAQMLLETGNGTSKIFKENKNPLGMKHNKRGFSKRAKNKHASYEDYAKGFEDYQKWQDRCLSLRGDINTTEDYIQMLDNLPLCRGCRYAEDSLYTQKVRRKLRVVRMLLSSGQQQSTVIGK